MLRKITSEHPRWIEPFTGLVPAQFHALVTRLAFRAPHVADGRPGSQWALPLADRVLLVGAHRRAHLTAPHLAALFGVSSAAARRVLAVVGPLLALAPAPRRSADRITIANRALARAARVSGRVQIHVDTSVCLVLAPLDPNEAPPAVDRTS